MSLKKANKALLALVAAAAVFLMGYAALAAADNQPGGSGDPLVTQSYVDKFVKWDVAELKAGQVLKGSAGSEIILRRGSAVIMDITGNGVPDLTAGVDIRAGGAVPVNHLLLIPREDGRGIKAVSPVVVMYRGGASIQ